MTPEVLQPFRVEFGGLAGHSRQVIAGFLETGDKLDFFRIDDRRKDNRNCLGQFLEHESGPGAACGNDHLQSPFIAVLDQASR